MVNEVWTVTHAGRCWRLVDDGWTSISKKQVGSKHERAVCRLLFRVARFGELGA
jgi:hypothetical protein